MAEATAVTKPKGGMSTLVIIILFVVLVGGGAGLWWFLKPKKKEETLDTTTPKTDGGATSHNNTANQYQGLTAPQIAALFGTNQTGQGPGVKQAGSKEKPWYINDPDFQKLLKLKAETMQGHTETMDLIRNKYDIGKAIVQSQNPDSLDALKSMFHKRPYPDGTFPDMSVAKYWLSFPIYGTKEGDGAAYRAELQNFVNKSWIGYNLTTWFRHSGEPWWLPKMKLNLLVGTTTAETPTGDQVWWSVPGHRERIDFFKKMNGHWVADQKLTDDFVNKDNPQQLVSSSASNARPSFCAGYMYSAVETWIAEIDRLDKVVLWEALRVLMGAKDKGGEGLYVSFLDPANPNSKFYADYNVSEDPTKVDTDPLFKPPTTA